MWDQIYLGIGVVVVGMIVALLLLRILDRLRGRAGQGEAALPPLIAVVIAGDREAMTKQLAAGEDIGQRDEHQRTALHHAVMQNDRVLVEILLDHDIAIDAADDEGYTALHIAAQEYLPEIAGMLIGRGANVNATDGYGNTVIARAVYDSRGRGEIIETLLAHGADPDIRNERGISAIELAHTIANYDVKQFFPGGGA